MSIYGNTKRVNSNTFQFDRIYPNRRAMDMALAAGTDGVYAGRYVLIEYGERYREATEDEISTSSKVREIEGRHLIQTDDFTNNANEDMGAYGVTYDSTVWQKIYISDSSFYTSVAGQVTDVPLKQRFIMVAELNAVTPRMVAISEDTYTYEYDPEDANKSLFVMDPDTNKYVRLYNAKENLNELYFDQVQDTELTYYLHLPSSLQLIAGQETIDYNDDGFNPYIYTSPKNKQSFIGWVPTFANPSTAIKKLSNDGRWVVNSAASVDDRQVNEKTLVMNLTAFGDAIGEVYNVLYGKASTEGGMRPYFARRGMSLDEAAQLGSQFDMSAPGNTIDTILANNSEGLAGVLGSILSETNPYTGTSRFFLSADWTAEGDIWSQALNTNTPTILNKPRIVASNADLQYKYNYWIDPNNRTNATLNTNANVNKPPLFLSEIEEKGYAVATNAQGQLIRNLSYTPPLPEEDALGHYQVVYDQAWQLQQIVTDESIATDDQQAAPTAKTYVELNITHSLASYNVYDVSQYTIPGDPALYAGIENVTAGILQSSSVALKDFTYRTSLPETYTWQSNYTSTTNSKSGNLILGKGTVKNKTYAFSPISFNYTAGTNSDLRTIYSHAQQDDLQTFYLYVHVKLNNYVELPALYQAYLYKLSNIISYTASTTISEPGREVVFVFDLLQYFSKLDEYHMLDDGNNLINFMVIGNTSNSATSSNPGQFTIQDISYVATYPTQTEVSEDTDYYTLMLGEGHSIPNNYSIYGEQIIYRPGYAKLTEGTFLPNGNNYCFPYDKTVNSIENDYLQGIAMQPSKNYQFVALKLSSGNCPNIMENKNRIKTDLNLYVHVRFDGNIELFNPEIMQVYLVNPTTDAKFTADGILYANTVEQIPEAYFIFNLYTWINTLELEQLFNNSGQNELIGYLVITGKTTSNCSAQEPGYIRILDISYHGDSYVSSAEDNIKTVSAGVGDNASGAYTIPGSNYIYVPGSDTLLEGRLLTSSNVARFSYEETENIITSSSIKGVADNPNTTYQFVPLFFSSDNASSLVNAYQHNDNVFLYVHVKYGTGFETISHASQKVFLYTPVGDIIYQANSAFAGTNGRNVTYVFNVSNYLDNIKFYQPSINFSNNATTLFYLAVLGTTDSTVDLESPAEIEILDVSYTATN